MGASGTSEGWGCQKVREEGGREASPCPGPEPSSALGPGWGLLGTWDRWRSGLLWLKMLFLQGASASQCGPPRHTPEGRGVNCLYHKPL